MHKLLLEIYCMSYVDYAFMLGMFTAVLSLLALGHNSRVAESNHPARLHYGYMAVLLLGLIFSILAIVAVTVLSRERGSIRIVHTIPGRMLQQYISQGVKEALRTLLMNIALFVPLGSFAAALNICRRSGEKKKFRFWIGLLVIVATAFVFSFVIETAQYLLACGESEADDIICNTLGAGLGWILVYLWAMPFQQLWISNS